MFVSLLTDATATGSSTQQLLTTILPIAALFLVFYFVLLRPEKKRKKEAEDMRNSLAVGDKITTIGGIMGTICSVKDDTITIETSIDKNKMVFAKWAVQTKEKKD